ncbi:MAG TPA: HAD family phosphatase [Pseudoxanthomonas sp.]|nr:HAD family phosphatase [Pseudoxanthomonas sp.]
MDSTVAPDTPAARPIGFRPQAVLFDMDGLMLESERVLLECWRQSASELGLALDDALWLSMIGVHDAASRELLRARLEPSRADALIRHCHALYDGHVQAGMPLKPGVVPLLEWLAAQGVPRAVVTSTRRERALQKLTICGLLPHFDAVVGGDEVARPKPAADPYLLAARRLALEPAACVVLEDSPTGVRAALAAGMTPIQVPDLLAPDAQTRALGHRIVASLAEAQRLLEPSLAP